MSCFDIGSRFCRLQLAKFLDMGTQIYVCVFVNLMLNLSINECLFASRIPLCGNGIKESLLWLSF